MPPIAPIRVMVVDDHQIMRDGLREVLERSGDFTVVGEAGDGDTALEIAMAVHPAVIMMDVMMPGKSGIDASREITETLPETRILILTASTQDDAVMEAVAAGATGFLQKHTGKDMLLQTVRDVAQGEYRIPAATMRRVFAKTRAAAHPNDIPNTATLTPREREILTLFAQGLSYAGIAELRGNSPLTIRNAIYTIQDKLAIDTKQQLVVWAVRNGLLDNIETSN